MLNKFHGIAERMWSVAENLQDKGIHKHISSIGESGEILHTKIYGYKVGFPV